MSKKTFLIWVDKDGKRHAEVAHANICEEVEKLPNYKDLFHIAFDKPSEVEAFQEAEEKAKQLALNKAERKEINERS